MQEREREELRALYARLEDLCLRAERGELGITSFLSPREAHYAACYLRRRGARFVAYGGYGDAERRRVYLLPDYMEERNDTQSEEAPDFSAYLAEYGAETEIAVLRIAGSGYRTLTHRDFLGSLLGLGIERDVLGDIVVENEEGRDALVFCDETIAPFIESEMTKAANDKVRISRPETWSIPPRRFASLHDTVASPRVDCVIAALCGLSREKARETVLGGVVEIDFESEDRPDRTVVSDSLISVRGFGRFRILRVEDRTKKGRYRLEAEKYL